jgi:hypothetical protein
LIGSAVLLLGGGDAGSIGSGVVELLGGYVLAPSSGAGHLGPLPSQLVGFSARTGIVDRHALLRRVKLGQTFLVAHPLLFLVVDLDAFTQEKLLCPAFRVVGNNLNFCSGATISAEFVAGRRLAVVVELRVTRIETV